MRRLGRVKTVVAGFTFDGLGTGGLFGVGAIDLGAGAIVCAVLLWISVDLEQVIPSAAVRNVLLKT